MIGNILLLIVGFIILIKGADVFVDGASSVASNFKVPKILIGLTIVAFGTSAPEFAVSIKSMLSNNGDIVLGNVIGSNIFNALLILGVASMFYPLTVKKNTVRKELPMTFLITLIFSVLISDNLFNVNNPNVLTRSDGIVIILFFTIFLYYLLSIAFKDRGLKEVEEPKFGILKSVIFTILGIGAIIIGSNLVVDKATLIAEIMGISDKVIALTIVAFGTSLPELVTSVIASIKKESDIAIGNVVGSNIFNICLVLGLPIILMGDVAAISFNYIDLGIMLLSSFILWLFTFKTYKLTKKEGILLIILFVAYYTYVLV